MKFTVERDALALALATVVGRAKGNTVAILQNIRIDAGECTVGLTGHDLASSSESDALADVSEEGSTTVPGEHFHKLVVGFPSGPIKVALDGKTMHVQSGRSRYKLGTLDAADFPEVLKVGNDPGLELSNADIAKLFGVASIASEEISRGYLCGVNIMVLGNGILVAQASDGKQFLRVGIECTANGPPIIVPTLACAEIVKLAGKGGAGIAWSDQIIGVSQDGRRYASKLVEGVYPNMDQIIPRPKAGAMVIERGELAQALARLIVMEDAAGAALEWDANPTRMVLRLARGDGEETIPCSSTGMPAGHTLVIPSTMAKLVGAIGAETIHISTNGPVDPILVTSPDDPHMVALQMPCMAAERAAAA